MKLSICLPAVCAGLLLSPHVHAGILFVGTATSEEPGDAVYTPAPVSYTLEYSTNQLDLEGAFVLGSTEEDFDLHTNTTECASFMVLPEGAEVLQIRLTMGGGSQILDRSHVVEDADEVLTQIIREAKCDALSAHLGSTLVSVPVGDQRGRGSVSVQWRQPVKAEAGVWSVTAPMPLASLSSGPVRRAVVRASISREMPVRAVFSPTHECTVTHTSEHQSAVHMSVDQLVDDTPFELLVVTAEDTLGLRMFTHRPESAEDGYFVLVGSATGRAEQQAVKEIVFVLDTSGSMRGDKMEQARAALEYCLSQLNPADRFNLVGFSDGVSAFQEAPVQATPEHLRAALSFLDELEPDGRTNIDEALAFAVSGEEGGEDSRLVIFLTDGTPTVGERKPEAILSRVKEENTSGARIFAMGIGHEINAYLLDRLAIETQGDSEYVDPEQDLDEIVAALYNRLAHPVLTDVAIDFGGLEVYDVTPSQIPDLYRDSLLMVAGRYKAGGSGEVRVYDREGEQAFSQAVTLPESEMDHAFVAPLWAARRLGDKLEQIRLDGESGEVLEEVVGLSRRYGIITEYTAVINDQQAAGKSDRELAAQVKQQVERARDVRSGKWAVMQSRNEKGLKSRVVNGAAENTYIDAQGETQQADNIRQIGSAAYYCREGVWSAAEDGKQRTQRVVKKFSEEYFELVKSNKDFSRAAALGDEVTVNVGDEQILVK